MVLLRQGEIQGKVDSVLWPLIQQGYCMSMGELLSGLRYKQS